MAGVESTHRTLPEVGAEAGTVAELGIELSRALGRVVPHDGYMLVGLDPLSGVGCFHSTRHGYSTAAVRRELADALGRDVHPFRQLAEGPHRVRVLSVGTPGQRHGVHLREVMVAEGFGSEMRIALTGRGMAWGAVVLVRELSRRPFSATEQSQAQRLVPALATALERFVGAKALRPARLTLPPGVLVVDANDRITLSTPSAQPWLAELARHCPEVDHDYLHGILWDLTCHTRRCGEAVVSRVPTPSGWVALHAQPTQQDRTAVAITVQAAPRSLVMPAIAAWYGLTPREYTVVEHALEGLPVMRIARLLQLSHYTVNDHLKSIYRKTRVNSRDELIAGITA
ncbi:helix-turn-helix transcriptional regulator [Nocardia transvalensis]|uniref:helix-turn-helix transcriptional regulator n=1 Tax=Nocardia transvalensis TaxID=37333 RepID=UPI001894A34C|nr:helix-turn-helix transcriptional regulator [Nocardia transvalensis]MBF6327737.1 helix-turn-helix transcriptional regulator [Nocardia transvalensis]